MPSADESDAREVCGRSASPGRTPAAPRRRAPAPAAAAVKSAGTRARAREHEHEHERDGGERGRDGRGGIARQQLRRHDGGQGEATAQERPPLGAAHATRSAAQGTHGIRAVPAKILFGADATYPEHMSAAPASAAPIALAPSRRERNAAPTPASSTCATTRRSIEIGSGRSATAQSGG